MRRPAFLGNLGFARWGRRWRLVFGPARPDDVLGETAVLPGYGVWSVAESRVSRRHPAV